LAKEFKVIHDKFTGDQPWTSPNPTYINDKLIFEFLWKIVIYQLIFT
jgi:hypothetical protein